MVKAEIVFDVTWISTLNGLPILISTLHVIMYCESRHEKTCCLNMQKQRRRSTAW